MVIGGTCEAFGANERLEPEKICPSVRGSIKFSLKIKCNARFDLPSTKDAVEAGDEFDRTSHGFDEPFDRGSFVQQLDPVKRARLGRYYVESAVHLISLVQS